MRKIFCIVLLLVAATVSKSQNVGVNTTSPNSTLDVNGALALRANALALTNADNNNISLGQFSYFRITGPTTAFAITGIAGGTDGRLITLYNSTTQAITIRNNSASSLASNQIKTMTGADIVFAAGNSSITLQYDITEARWIVLAQQGPETAKTLNQSAATVYGTSSLVVTSATPFTIVPGLTQTVNVPANTTLFITTTGGLTTTAITATGFSLCDIAFAVDGVLLPNGGYQRVYAANTTGVPSGMISYWHIANALTLSAGSHNISVFAAGAGLGSNSTVSGPSSSILQGTLTVMMIKN